jgi:hypothetical protein
MRIPFAFKIAEVPCAISKYRYWVIVNLIGIGVFIHNCVSCWTKDDTGKMEDTINIAISWSLANIPLIFILAVVNMCWLLVIVRSKNRPAAFVWLLTVVLWLVIIRLEFWIRHPGQLF